ncbi:MAG: DUF1349 domain-containing protein [Gemmataceae bacterium]
MIRCAFTLLAVAPLVVAAPVPKDTERQRIEKLYGKIVDPKGDSKFELDGTKLKITLPANEVRTFSYTVDPDDPKNSKKYKKINDTPRVEFTAKGDFVLTVRITAPLNDDAEPARGDEDRPFHCGGLQIYLPDAEWIRYGFGRTRRERGVEGVLTDDGPRRWVAGGLGSRVPAKDPTADSYIVRATRVGASVTFEASADGKNWDPPHSFGGCLTNDELTLTLFAQHASSKARTVTFSEF